MRGFKGLKVLTFPLVQLLLHDLDSLSELQTMIRLLFLPHICQKPVPLLTPLQELLQNYKVNNTVMYKCVSEIKDYQKGH